MLFQIQDMLRLLGNIGASGVSAEITGPLTLDAAQGPFKDELDKLVREAESIVCEARKYQVPYITDLNKTKKVRLDEKQQYYSGIRNVNYRIDDVSVFFYYPAFVI